MATPMDPRLLVASVFTRRRVLVGCFLIPGLCILLPLLSIALSAALSLISGGLPRTVICISLICHYRLQPLVPGALKQVVADEYLYAEKLAQSKKRLPIYSVVVSGVICRLILRPLYRFVFGDAAWYDGGSLGVLLRIGITLAFSTSVLSLSIVFRYLGPISIMRSSSVPLRPTPFVAAISSLRHQISAAELTRPDEARINYRYDRLQHSSSSPLGGRYLTPPLPLLLAQVVLHAVIGATFASVVQTQLLPAIANEATANGGFLFACLASPVLTFVFTVALDGKSHELQIEHRSHFIEQTLSPGDAIRAVFVRSMSKVSEFGAPLLALFVFLLSVVTSVLNLVEAGGETSFLTVFVLASASVCAASLFVCLYLVVVDEIVRRIIATSGVDVDRLLISHPDTMLVAEDLFIHSVIFGCDGGDELRCRNIINDLAKERLGGSGAYSVSSLISFNFEEEEVRRNDAAIEAVAQAMITPSSVPAARGRALEEDVLRVALLESLGGTSGTFSCNFDGTEVGEQAIPSRYYVALRKRLLVSEEILAKKSQSVQQPRVVPLIRALLAASGGFGEALLSISKGDRSLGSDNGFVLPPGATSCAEYSLLAAARFIALNIKLGTNGDRGYLHWVSLLSPAFFHSAFRLQSGVCEYAKHRKQLDGGTAATHSDLGSFIAVNFPDLWRLLQVCGNGARLVLSALEEHERGRNCEVLVHSDCKAWLANLK